MPGSPFELPKVRFGNLDSVQWYNISGLDHAGRWSEMHLGSGGLGTACQACLLIHDMNCFVFFFGSGQCWLVASKEKR